MDLVKSFAMVLIGILVFTGCSVYSAELYSGQDREASSLSSAAQGVMEDIRASEDLVHDRSGPGIFSAQKVSTVQANNLTGWNVEFQLQIIDVSGYDEEISRSLARGNPVQTAKPPAVVGEGELVTIHSAAAIKVGPDEVHGARLVLKVWEA